MPVEAIINGDMLIEVRDPSLATELDRYDVNGDRIIDASDFLCAQPRDGGVPCPWLSTVMDSFVYAGDIASQDGNTQIFETQTSNLWWNVERPIPCRDSGVFSRHRYLPIEGVYIPFWDNAEGDDSRAVAAQMSALVGSTSVGLLRYLFFGNGGSTLKLITTHDRDIGFANRCVGEHYPEIAGAFFNAATWTIYLPTRGLSAPRDATSPTLFSLEMTVAIHELMHVLHRRLGLQNPEQELWIPPGSPSSLFMVDGMPRSSIVAQFANQLAKVFTDRADYDRFMSDQWRRWRGQGLDATEMTYYQAKKVEVLRHFVSVSSLVMWQDYFAESATSYINQRTPGYNSVLNENDLRNRSELRSVDPVMHLLFESAFSGQTALQGGFSAAAFRSAYGCLGLDLPREFQRFVCP